MRWSACPLGGAGRRAASTGETCGNALCDSKVSRDCRGQRRDACYVGAIVEAYMYAQRHHGIFILHPCVALHTDFGGKVMHLRIGQGRAFKVSDKNVAFQENMRQNNRDTEFGELG